MPEINKVVFGGRTLMDVTGDTVTPEKLFKGVTAHAADGTTITGTAEITFNDGFIIIPDGFFEMITENANG